VLGPNNLLVTGDFPNFSIEQIEKSIGPDCLAMFFNGTQGNISMGHSSELSAIGVITPGRTFERAAEIGHLLADAALAELPAVITDGSQPIASISMPVDLPLKKFPSIEETTRILQNADEQLTTLTATDAATEQVMMAKTQRLYASITNFYARETGTLPDGHLSIELQGVRIGDAVFVAIPAEVFVEIGLKVKHDAPHRVFIVGIANGYIGYLPTREAHNVGGYEVVSSKCRPEAAEVLVENVVSLTRQFFRDGAGS
jgi:hypothetical protein